MLGKEVYNKRNGVRGVISGSDSLTLTIDVGGVEQVVTYTTYNKWWVEVPMEQPEEVEVVQQVMEDLPPKEPEKQTKQLDYDLSNSEKYVGFALCDKFLVCLKSLLNDDISYIYNEKMKAYVVKYKGFNIFEVYPGRKKLSVLAHPESLMPANKKRAYKIYPKEFGWALRAKFVFDTDDVGAAQIMRSIIQDGLFYRSQRVQPK